MESVKIGIIGGSGLYEMSGAKIINKKWFGTPFGYPSDKIVIAKYGDHHFAFLPRHGVGHRLNPTEVNNRANIYAMKLLGVECLIGVSACGSLREELKPRDIVICDQLVDYTKRRNTTFFDNGIVAHLPMADPYCPRISKMLFDASLEEGLSVHYGGTYICIEGPQFSTRAESGIYRKLGIDVIGMTNAPEAKLAREAGICYAIMACVTDYDVWYEGEQDVTNEMVIENLMKNVENVQKVLKRVIPRLYKSERNCKCPEYIKSAIATNKGFIPADKKGMLGIILKDIDK